ncbi:hypothetical protein B7494_g6258 [Chlorociboria aeruginascens]|nr:hypothetical protein B7494_g6258 [Chlorociboria aeruginascens]
MPPGYASRDVGDPSQMKKNNKQSMADLKLRRLTELNNRLREDLERERIPVSQAAKSIISYTNSTKDFMVPSVWGTVEKREDPYAPQPSGIINKEHADVYAQELLSTFSHSIGEVALQPSVGGVFTVTLYTSTVPRPPPSPPTTTTADPSNPVPSLTATPRTNAQPAHGKANPIEIQTHILWDRKTEGGFPETKILKQRVRDIIEPGRGLGHVDRDGKGTEKGGEQVKGQEGKEGKEKEAVGGEGEGKGEKEIDNAASNDHENRS